MSQTFKLYKAAVTKGNSDLVFKDQEYKDKDLAIKEMTDSNDGFMVTKVTDGYEEVLGLAKWGKNSFLCGGTVTEDRIRNKATAAATLGRLIVHEDNPEKQKSKSVTYNKDGSVQKPQGRPRGLDRKSISVNGIYRVYNAYFDERNVMVFNSTEYADIDEAREAARGDDKAFVLVKVDKETEQMKVRKTYNAAFKYFGPNQKVTIAQLHETAIKLILPPTNDKPVEKVKVPEEPASAPEATSEHENKKTEALSKVEIVNHTLSDKNPPTFYLTKQSQTVKVETEKAAAEEEIASPNLPNLKESLKALGEGAQTFWDNLTGKEIENRPTLPTLSTTKPTNADAIYDALIENQSVATRLMIQHVEMQGALQSLEKIEAESAAKIESIQAQIAELERQREEAKVNSTAKREELKIVTRKLANVLGGAEDATS